MIKRTALLLSGGIGDYLHYIACFSDFVERSGTDVSGLTVFVESTVPEHVGSLFDIALPDVTVSYISANLHWTRTNPLLTPLDIGEQKHRPAYDYVRSIGYERIVDWFLPICCQDYRYDLDRVNAIVRNDSNDRSPTIVVSLRDKGFLWWPNRDLLRKLALRFSATHAVRMIGTAVESIDGIETETLPDVRSALVASVQADLFVGVDTGLATIRELLGKPNLYCISAYWKESLMQRYGYLPEQIMGQSSSRFVFDSSDFLEAIRPS